jgi:hypothetical protein
VLHVCGMYLPNIARAPPRVQPLRCFADDLCDKAGGERRVMYGSQYLVQVFENEQMKFGPLT